MRLTIPLTPIRRGYTFLNLGTALSEATDIHLPPPAYALAGLTYVVDFAPSPIHFYNLMIKHS